jgi:hypothetical protein
VARVGAEVGSVTRRERGTVLNADGAIVFAGVAVAVEATPPTGLFAGVAEAVADLVAGAATVPGLFAGVAVAVAGLLAGVVTVAGLLVGTAATGTGLVVETLFAESALATAWCAGGTLLVAGAAAMP